jgi:hypothetical protein
MLSQALEPLLILLDRHFLFNMFALLVVDRVVQRIMAVVVVLEDTLQEALPVQQVQ